MANVLRWLLGTVLCLLAVSFAGALHPAGDSFAVLRLPLAVLALVLVLILRRQLWLSLPGLGLASVALLTVLGTGTSGTSSGAPVLIYQKNLKFNNDRQAALLADIRSRAPDVITFQEVSRLNRPLMAALADDWPAQSLCPFTGVGGVAVLSRWPAVEGSEICLEGKGLSALQVVTDTGPVWIVSIHLHWPWPFGQAAQVDEIIPVLEALEGPRIIGGDFNMVPWSYTMARFQRATNTARARTREPTFRTSPLPIPMTIDHVLAHPRGAGETTVLPGMGSDHNVILARVHPAE